MARAGRFIERMLIDAVLLLTGVVATYLAVRYTYGWHVWAGDPPVEAMGFSLVIVLFSIMMFEFAVESAHKKSRWAVAMFAAWLITALYSMQATMAGQYIGIQRKALERLEVVKEERTSGVELDSVGRQIELARAELKPYQDRQVQLLKVLADIDTVEERYEWKRTVENTEKQLEETNKKITEYTERIGELEERAAELQVTVKLEELRGSSGDVFAFYSEVLGIENVEKVEFWMTVYRSVALDTVNVLCFMLVMVRRRKRGENADDPGLVVSRPARAGPDSGDENVREGTDEGITTRDDSGSDGSGVGGDASGMGVAMGGEGGIALACEREAQPSKSTLEILAEDTYSPGRRNGTFTSWVRAKQLGCQKDEYARTVARALRRGVLVRRGGVLYRNGYFGKEDFIREVLTEGW